MIKKRVLYGLLIFFGKIHTMELIQKVEQLVSSPEGKSVEDTMVNFVKSPTGQNILQEVETKAESLFSHSTATSATTTTAMTTTLKRSAITTATTATTTTTSTTPTIVVNNDTAVHNAINQNQQSLSSSSQIKNVQEKAPLSKSNQPSNQVPNLQLNNALPLTTALSGSLKTPNKNIDQLSKNIKHVKAAQTARDNSPSGANTPSVSGNQVDTVVNVDKLGKEPITSNFSLQAYDDTPQMYTEAYVWYVVQTSNPVLWKFAQDNKLSLEKTLLIGQLKKELDVSPDVCVDYINKLKSADKKTVITAEEYAKVQKKDPQKYKEMIYEILTSLLHEQEGKDTSTSPLANTHIQLAEQKITDQDDSLKKRCGGWITTIVGAIVTGIGLGAWGLYGQLTKMNEAPTMMPTMMPVAPTFPTFEPTIAPT